MNNSKHTRVVIIIDGGMVSDVYSSDRNISVEVVDLDAPLTYEESEETDKAYDSVVKERDAGKLVAIY